MMMLHFARTLQLLAGALAIGSAVIPVWIHAAPADSNINQERSATGPGTTSSLTGITPQNAASHLEANNNTPHWVYTNVRHATDELPPAHWEDQYPQCAGARQSPIEIDDSLAVIDWSLEPLNFSSYSMHPVGHNWTVKNNGHSVVFTASFVSMPELRQGSLGASYAFSQFHFHWGSQDKRGSEHVMDGKRFPLELHLVHRKVGESKDQSHADSTGLSVVGVMFDAANEHELSNIHMDALSLAVEQSINPGDPITLTLPNLNLVDLLPDHQDYYRYLGSLTTPPCDESVVWNVMKTPIKITETQLNVFRSLHHHSATYAADDFLSDNFRPIQRTNGRIVRYHPDMMVAKNLNVLTTNAARTAVFLNPSFSFYVLFLSFSFQ